jgi:hypothetical protein
VLFTVPFFVSGKPGTRRADQCYSEAGKVNILSVRFLQHYRSNYASAAAESIQGETGGQVIPTRPLSIVIGALGLCSVLMPGQAQLQPVNGITSQEIVSRLASSNHRRNQMLQRYTAQRHYHLVYTGLPGHREADMVVDVHYKAPASKDFTIVSTSGSNLIINRVFKKLLETEKEAADEKSQASTALTAENYNFDLQGQDVIDGRPSYVLMLNPKTDNRLLYRGRIWVDAADFAVARIEAEPAKRPSFWISHTRIHHEYRKVGEFWLPAQNQSTSDIRLGGHAQLSISYGRYQITSTPGLEHHASTNKEDVSR